MSTANRNMVGSLQSFDHVVAWCVNFLDRKTQVRSSYLVPLCNRIEIMRLIPVNATQAELDTLLKTYLMEHNIRFDLVNSVLNSMAELCVTSSSAMAGVATVSTVTSNGHGHTAASTSRTAGAGADMRGPPSPSGASTASTLNDQICSRFTFLNTLLRFCGGSILSCEHIDVIWHALTTLLPSSTVRDHRARSATSVACVTQCI